MVYIQTNMIGFCKGYISMNMISTEMNVFVLCLKNKL